MSKILQAFLILGFLVFTMPQAFSQVQEKPDCSFCELKAKGVEKCQKCLSNEKNKCPLPGKGSGDGDKTKCELYKKLKHGPYINTTVLENLIEANVPMVLLDARSGKWDDKNRIPSAQSLNDKSTKEEVEKIIKAKDTLVVTYCSSLKCGASNKLYIHLKKLGYKNVLEYPFGIKGWLEAGNDIEMSSVSEKKQAEVTIFEGEKHFKNIRQLTFGGENAEAYFSHNADKLIFQSKRDDLQCDAIFTMDVDGSNVKMLSSGKGTTTCSFIAPDYKSIIYASTHLGGEACPPKPDMSKGYVWALYKSFDIFSADPDGSNLVRLTDTPGYDAEGVYSPKGDRIIFTSVRTGDLELFLMNPDGSNVEQLTDTPGYDGGAFFSLDGEWICWRASRPQGEGLTDYMDLLDNGLIRPSKLEIYVMNLKERKPIQLTSNSSANFGPYFHPNGEKVIFVSNMDDPQHRNFEMYTVDIKTKAIERISYNPTFDGFPMFSHDGKKLVFASNRNNSRPHETNIFIADWVD